jgi:hypothetical protein
VLPHAAPTAHSFTRAPYNAPDFLTQSVCLLVVSIVGRVLYRRLFPRTSFRRVTTIELEDGTFRYRPRLRLGQDMVSFRRETSGEWAERIGDVAHARRTAQPDITEADLLNHVAEEMAKRTLILGWVIKLPWR